MSRIELFQLQPQNEVDPDTGAEVVGFGYGLRDATTGAPLPAGDPSLAPQGIQVFDLIALDRYPYAAQDPSFDPGRVLALVPDHNQGGAVGVWDETRHVQVGWLPGTAATVVNEALAQGWSQHAVALWAQRTPDDVRTGLRIAVSTDLLPIGGPVATPSAPVAAVAAAVPEPAPAATPPAPDAWTPTTAPPEVKRGKGAVWAVLAVILAVVIAAAVYFAFFRGGNEPEPTTTTEERTTTSIATTAPPTVPTTAPPTVPPTEPPTVPPTEPLPP
ncbi:MAG: hypothetical protein IT198_01610 [Acidimicrobiia bacterium]|nr:hypothetical protein [Acidimicrobiia bacterium]